MKRIFSVEMKSKKDISILSLSDENKGHVVFEGNLGEYTDFEVYTDGVELVGSNGTLRFTVSTDDFKQIVSSWDKFTKNQR